MPGLRQYLEDRRKKRNREEWNRRTAGMFQGVSDEMIEEYLTIWENDKEKPVLSEELFHELDKMRNEHYGTV